VVIHSWLRLPERGGGGGGIVRSPGGHSQDHGGIVRITGRAIQGWGVGGIVRDHWEGKVRNGRGS